LLGFALATYAEKAVDSTAQNSKETPVTVHHAVGPFDVKGTPVPPPANASENPISEISLDKQFHGALDAMSKGTMLAFGDPAKGSGGYVAMEKITGTLEGRKGSFVLQHTGTINRGATELTITVVPGSGTEELTGIGGKMAIQNRGGQHSYDFEYTLPAAP
jgi:hypothetical protein